MTFDLSAASSMHYKAQSATNDTDHPAGVEQYCRSQGSWSNQTVPNIYIYIYICRNCSLPEYIGLDPLDISMDGRNFHTQSRTFMPLPSCSPKHSCKCCTWEKGNPLEWYKGEVRDLQWEMGINEYLFFHPWKPVQYKPTGLDHKPTMEPWNHDRGEIRESVVWSLES